MRSATASLATAIGVTVAVACARPLVSAPRATSDAMRLTGRSPVMTVEQLRQMPGVTALDALRTMPGYTARVGEVGAPHFTLILDGLRAKDLGVLSSIRATDLFEIRILSESQANGSFGGAEIIVTTLDGHKRRP
jgi:hypothetical protein